MDLRRLYPWVIRVAWVALPFAMTAAVGAALHPQAEAVRLTGAIMLWAGWALVLVGTLVPWPVGLTGLRLCAPAAFAVTLAAIGTGRPSVVAAVAAAVVSGADLVLALSPATGSLYVNGPAYPNERRFPLRPPGALLLGPIELSWAAVVGAPTIGVLLLAGQHWVAGPIVVVIGVPAAFVLARSLHALARRWVVFVPAGVVLHDPMSLLDPVLFTRQTIETLRPAPADSDSLDLTHGALGLALELVLREKVPMTRAKPGQVFGEQGASARLLFTPTRPGQVLAEAGRRRVPVG